MSEYTKQLVGRQAAELGFIRDTFEKVCRLSELLAYFETESTLSRYLALKGGTAINLTIFNLPRLSVDIDLDFSENLSRDEMLAARKDINDVLSRYMVANGYMLNEAKSKHYHTLDSFVYHYTNTGGVSDNIKVEINYALRAHILPLTRRPVITLGVLKPSTVFSLDIIEIFASKSVALLMRAAARDLYDLNNAICYGLFDDSQADVFRKCVVFYSAVGSDTIPEAFDFDRIKTITPYRIRTDLTPVIRKKEHFDLTAAQERVKNCLTEKLTLTENERSFLAAFQSKEYRPELLFNGKMLENAYSHPMALWKMQEHGSENVNTIT